MSTPSDTGFGFYMLVFGALFGIPALVVWLLVFIPPYFANRDVASIMQDVCDKYADQTDENFIIGQVNRRLMNIRTLRYELDDDNKQRDTTVLQLTPDELTVTHESNQALTLDADYDETMVVPILNRVQVYHFHDHAESAAK